MSEIKTLFKQSSHYFTGRIVIMALGFISFPILTRIFSVGDYGLLGLLSTTLFIIIAVSKLGLPASIVRFHAEFKSKNQLEDFYSTLLSGTMGVAAIVAISFYVATQLMHNVLDVKIVQLLPLVSLLIFTKCSNTILTSFLRAEQRTKLYNLIEIMRRYVGLFLGIFFVFFFIKGLYGFYFGEALASGMILLLLVNIYRKKLKLNLANFSRSILKDSIRYGFPLIWAELGHLVLNYADRYLIQFYMGSISLGIYTVGYNLSSYITELIIYPINYAMTPVYMNILVNKGEEETKEFFTKLFRFFLLIMFPISFGFMAIGKELIAFLASSKYLEAHIILPYVIIGQLIYASSLILNTGLFIRKKTRIVTSTMVLACILNVGFNVVLIPSFGIVGAAQATLISYIIYTLVISYYAFKEFSFKIDSSHIFIYLGIAVSMYFLLGIIDIGSLFGNLFIKISVGAVFYISLVLIFDKDLRDTVNRVVKKGNILKLKRYNATDD